MFDGLIVCDGCGIGQIRRNVFLAKIIALKQLLQQDDVGPLRSGLTHQSLSFGYVFGHIPATCHLGGCYFDISHVAPF